MIPVVMPTYSRIDVVFERGVGCALYDTAGRRFLDFTSGIAVNALGHAHPYLVEKLHEQAQKLWHTSNLFRVAGQETLAGRLTAALPFADTVFFTNSGVEAWECGIKVARKYQDAVGHPERYRFIVAGGCFHGRTMTAIAASGQDKMVKGFGPLLDSFDRVPYDDLAAVEAALTAETAAIVVEPILGEGGIRPASPGYLKALRDLADRHGVLLFLDEIQTGVARSGKLFAYQYEGIEPDIMCIAKGIGGGFPVGACLASEKAAIGMVAGTHGSTFGGNPLAMAVANAVLDVIERPGFMERVNAAGALLRTRLEDVVSRHPDVLDGVRGCGLILGLKAKVPVGTLVDRLRGNGLLVVSAADNVARILPPLIVSDEEIGEAVAILDRTAADLAAA